MAKENEQKRKGRSRQKVRGKRRSWVREREKKPFFEIVRMASKNGRDFFDFNLAQAWGAAFPSLSLRHLAERPENSNFWRQIQSCQLGIKWGIRQNLRMNGRAGGISSRFHSISLRDPAYSYWQGIVDVSVCTTVSGLRGPKLEAESKLCLNALCTHKYCNLHYAVALKCCQWTSLCPRSWLCLLLLLFCT